jgi:hypothetical protein
MNETLSLLIVTSVLAVSGLGLFLYKSTDENQSGGNYNEDEIFDSEKSNNDNNDNNEEVKVKSKVSKTKRNKKSFGTKRRY